MTRPVGIDISKYQVALDPDVFNQVGDFIFWRTSYGMIKDERYEQLKGPVQEVERRGAYHYFSTGSPWKDQADFLVDLTSGKGIKSLAVDYEHGYNNLNSRSAIDYEKMLRYLISARPNKKIIGYFNPSTYRDYIAPHVDIRDIPAWIARYFMFPLQDTRTKVYLTNTDRSDFEFLQYTDKGSAVIYGTNPTNTVDLNVFNGTMDELDDFFNIRPPDPDPEPVLDDPVECTDCKELKKRGSAVVLAALKLSEVL